MRELRIFPPLNARIWLRWCLAGTAAFDDEPLDRRYFAGMRSSAAMITTVVALEPGISPDESRRIAVLGGLCPAQQGDGEVVPKKRIFTSRVCVAREASAVVGFESAPKVSCRSSGGRRDVVAVTGGFRPAASCEIIHAAVLSWDATRRLAQKLRRRKAAGLRRACAWPEEYQMMARPSPASAS